MAIKKDKDFCFIHITKTGGVSIINELELTNDDGHKTYKELKEKYGDTITNYYAVVRNPYDRFISAFFFMKQFVKDNRYDHIVERGMVDTLIYSIDRKNRVDEYPLVLKPQYEFLKGAKEGIIVLKFEDFYNTYCFLCEELKIKPKKNIEKMNASKHEDWRKYYRDNKELQSLVQEMYIEDFELFGYNLEIK